MPSTIRIKRSSVAGKKPTTSDISTGELAINTKDFKLFSSNGTAVFELGNAGALANTNARINLINTNLLATNTALRAIDATKLAVSNAATLYATKSNPTTSGLLAHTGRATISTNLTVSGNASVTGTMTASGVVSGLELTSSLASGDEGGQINLAKPPNATTSGGVTIDAYQNRLRIFEQGGTARGVYIDLTAASAGVGTNLLASSGGATWTALTSTNTALRTLISDRLQVANAAAIYQTKAVERAALANTNASIATQATRVTLVNTNLTGTNTALRTLINARMQVSNVNTLVAARATWTALTGTNTALRTLISDRLQVANASTLYATKSNPTTSGLLAHTGRATISTNLTVSGNVSVSGTSSLSNITVAQGSQAYFYHASQTDVNDGRIGAGTFDTGLNIVGVQTAAATGRIVRLYGAVIAMNDYRAPIYYDSNNTAYYLDPAGTSVLNTLNPYTVATGSGQFTTALAISPSTHATSRRAALSLDDWLLLQDSNGNGTKNFSIYSSVAASNRFSIDTSGNVDAAVSYRAPFFYSSSDTNAYWSAGTMVMRSASPTIYFRDTDHNSAMIHVNSNLFYILRGGNDSTSWTQVNGQWPFIVDLSNNTCTVGGTGVAVTDFRAPIFYDSVNTAYYVDPASSSVLNNVYLDGTVYMRGTEASQTLTDAATIAWDTNSGRIATVTLGASRTMGAPTNAKVGTYVLYVIQGGTGSYNITWNSVFKWPGGVAPTLSTTVGRRDIFTFIYDGTNFYGSYINDVR